MLISSNCPSKPHGEQMSDPSIASGSSADCSIETCVENGFKITKDGAEAGNLDKVKEVSIETVKKQNLN